MGITRQRDYSHCSITQLKMLLNKKIDNGETRGKVIQIIQEISKRSKITPIHILNSVIIKHRAFSKTRNKELQIKIKDVNKELNDFIKSANKLKKISVNNLIN